MAKNVQKLIKLKHQTSSLISLMEAEQHLTWPCLLLYWSDLYLCLEGKWLNWLCTVCMWHSRLFGVLLILLLVIHGPDKWFCCLIYLWLFCLWSYDRHLISLINSIKAFWWSSRYFCCFSSWFLVSKLKQPNVSNLDFFFYLTWISIFKILITWILYLDLWTLKAF